MALPIYVPLAYVGILIFSLSVFSRIYRRRSARRLAGDASSQPWFPEGHPERDIYQTLVAAASAAEEEDGEQGAGEGKEKPGKIPEEVLKAALLNRAMADVRRIMRMREDKQALQQLLQKGSLGDETAERFALAEKELEAEILDVVSEANTFREGWGQIIFPTASEMVSHLKHKEAYYGIPLLRQEEIRKLQAAGKPVPKPNVELPPLITPPGTTIQIQAPGPAAPPAGLNGAAPGAAPGQVAGPGAPPPGAQQIPLQLPPQIAQMIAANGGQITPQMLPMIAHANGGQLPAPLLAAIQQAQQAQLKAQQAQAQAQAQASKANGASGPAKKTATVEDAGDE